MPTRRPPAHLWLALLYVVSLAVWPVGWVAGVLFGLVLLWRLILLRRRAFRETYESATGRHRAVLMIDLNGVEAVGAFERVLRLVVPSPGRTVHLGPGRLAVALPGLDSPGQAYEVAGRLAASVAPVVVAGRLVGLTASIGVAVSAPGELTFDVLMHRAAVAMERARRFAPETRWAAWREWYEETAVAA